ncbi:MAG: DEAD/DEAH box helicase [Planctomycetes bacterium]|jgi:DNA repair protein RadD|nr:DEAD/DEAH box helicase [Planctomycetota bacterium]
MSRFNDFLSRADAPDLQELIGQRTVQLIAAMTGDVPRPTTLRRTLLIQRSPEELLNEKTSRNLIIDLLSSDEATKLCELLDRAGQADPWGTLKSANPRANQMDVFLGFFGVVATEQKAEIEYSTVSEVEPVYSLFAHQKDAVSNIETLFRDGHRKVFLHMPTGSGKTRTAMHLITNHLRQHQETVVFWLAHSEELCAQAAEEFEKAWKSQGDRSVQIYRLWGGNQIEPAEFKDGLVIASLQTAYSRQIRTGNWLAIAGDNTSFVIMDEAHQAIAETYQLVLDALIARRAILLGLSATPGRTWNDPEQDRILADYFDQKKVTLEIPGYASPVEYLIDKEYLARPEFRTIEVDTPHGIEDFDQFSSEFEIPNEILKRLAEDQIRTIKIIRQVIDLVRRHKRLIVFATTVEHSVELANVLETQEIACRSVTSKSSTVHRQQAIAWFKQDTDDVRVITNFGVLTQGFDAPKTSAALIARPTTSLVLYSQMVGRATRGLKAGGNATAEILTVVDTCLPGFGDIAQAFGNWEDVW